MIEYRNLNDVFEVHKNESPERILERIREFFVSCGNDFRNGLISEEEFYLATNYGMPCVNPDSVYIKLCKIKNAIQVDWSLLSNNSEFKEAYNEWKNTGQIQIKSWMKRSIIRKGDLEEAVKWVFSVLDACKIPTCEFDVLMGDYKGAFPEDICWCYSSDSVKFVLMPPCTNIEKLLQDPSPKGKNFSLHVYGDICVEMEVNEVGECGMQKCHYTCTGTITDYVKEPQHIDIYFEKDSGQEEISFCYKKLSELQTIMQTFVNPIPHPQWNEYETIRFERLLRREAEYKLLRLPFMLETTETNPSGVKTKKKHSHNKPKVINIYFDNGKVGGYPPKKENG